MGGRKIGFNDILYFLVRYLDLVSAKVNHILIILLFFEFEFEFE